MLRFARILLWLAFGASVLVTGCAGAGVFEPVSDNWMSVAFTILLCGVTGVLVALAGLLCAYRVTPWVAALSLVLATLPSSYVALAVWGQGFRSLAELDLNGDGSTSLSEIVTAMDVVITQSPEKPHCKEYIDAKTGSHTFKISCPSVG